MLLLSSPILVHAIDTIVSLYSWVLHDPLALTPYLSLHPTSIASPIATAIIYTLAISYACWFLSVTTGNYSYTDRLWSITPVLFTYIFAAKELFLLYNGATNVEYRLVAIFAIVLVWGLRLTYNFYRKGGYNYSSQDYRWTYLQEIVPFVLYQFFNIVFIALYQNVLLLLITLPTYYIYYYRTEVSMTLADYAALSLAFIFVIFEAIADQQQWNFQQDKQRKIDRRQQVTRKFITTGLWRYSRHPNFFCEQMIWVMIYLSTVSISIAKENSYLNWSVVGCVLLILLFQGSTTFTESITLKKYPEYKNYQAETNRLIPFFSSSKHKKQ